MKDRISEQRRQAEALKNLSTLKLALGAIKKAQGLNYPDSMKATLVRSHASLLWDAIPTNVASINLGDGVQENRSEDKLIGIPSNQRVGWSLQDLDAHGAEVARSLGQVYEPVFSK